MTTHTKESELTSIFTIWENDHFFFTAVDIIAKKKLVMRVLTSPIKDAAKTRSLNRLFLSETKYSELLRGYGLIFIACLFVASSFFILFLVHTLMHKSYVNC